MIGKTCKSLVDDEETSMNKTNQVNEASREEIETQL